MLLFTSVCQIYFNTVIFVILLFLLPHVTRSTNFFLACCFESHSWVQLSYTAAISWVIVDIWVQWLIEIDMIMIDINIIFQ